jgi:demethylmenaquinone methyltransferase/2-methoxy-6-polyprenyl-1,4-benzoquinol methylase
VSQIDSRRQQLIQTYRKKAKHYDITSRFYPVPGYPQRAQRLRAVQALRLRPGDTVVDIACGTGLNFSLLEQAIGAEGRIVGVDLTDAMLAQAQHRIETNGWHNISLVQADAAAFDFPTEVDAILSTYALSQVPECGDVVAHGAAALSRGGRWAVLDLKVPDNAPRWLAQSGIALVRPFASIDEWFVRRPWEAIRAAMEDGLADVSWTELSFGSAFLAAGSRGSRTVAEPSSGSDHEGGGDDAMPPRGVPGDLVVELGYGIRRAALCDPTGAIRELDHTIPPDPPRRVRPAPGAPQRPGDRR